MPRVNFVKRAQQRYATKPVIDPATGVQKVTPMMNNRTGQPKVTKTGRPVVLRITERDLERPLPMPQCDYPGCSHPTREIAVGTSYKWIEPSGQRVRNRHADCPTWKVWEYSSSLSARIAQITDECPVDFESLEDAQQWASDKAQEIRDLAEEKRESSQNIRSSAWTSSVPRSLPTTIIVDGFGHETEQSMELEQIADDLESWADDVENVDLPEFPEDDEPEHEGYEEALEKWQAEVQEALDNVMQDCPV